MIAKQRGEGAHLLDALWFRTSGDVAKLRRLHLHCRNKISEMIEYLEESKTKETTGARKARLVIKLSRVSGERGTKWKSTVK